MDEMDFRLVIQELLSRYDGTPLLARWQEATSFGAGREATDYWIRDTGGITNVVWLNSDGIRDVTLVHRSDDAEETQANSDSEESAEDEPERENPPESMFNFLPLRNISTIEVREGPDIAQQMGLGVNGDKLVHVIPNSGGSGHLYWVAESLSEVEGLNQFLKSVFSAYVHSI